MTARREGAWFYGTVATMWVLFVVEALHAPTVLDDWSALAWLRHHELGGSSIWHHGRQLGDMVLLLLDGARWFHVAATPLVELALLPFVFAIASGRWPRPTLRDLQLLLAIQLLIWMIAANPGVVYFTRPAAASSLWPIAITLALFVPYRLELGARWWLVPIVAAAGWCAGLCDEVGGAVAMIAMAAWTWRGWRRQQLRAWMIAGALGLFAGYATLLASFVRPATWSWHVWFDQLGHAQLAIDVVFVMMLVGLRRARMGQLARGTQLAIAALVVGAGGLVMTPFASAVLAAGALALVIDWMFADAGLRRVVAIACVLGLGYHVARFVETLATAGEQNRARVELLASAAPNTVATIPPYASWQSSRWWPGDELRSASLREYVANEVYALNGIEFDRHVSWAETMPPERFLAMATFVPPVTPQDQQAIAPRYIPRFPKAALAQLRDSLASGPIGALTGHALQRFVVEAVGAQLDEPGARPVRVFDWTPEKLTMIDGWPIDERGRTYIEVRASSVPPNTIDAFVVACGRTRRVQAEPANGDRGPLIPIELDCRAPATAYLCDAATCWLAGRYWP